MRWEDERYVRLYTRDTIDWLNLSLEAQALFSLLLRKVDRAGLLPLGKHGERGVASAIGHPTRWDTIKPALDELLADGCIVVRDGVLLVPNFTEAQEARQSDKARQQKSRESARTKVQTGVPANEQSVTNRDETSHAVTAGHTTSHGVTPSCAVPSRAVPSVPSGGSAASPPPSVAAIKPAPVKKQPPPSVGEPGEFRDRIDAEFRRIQNGATYAWTLDDEKAVGDLLRMSNGQTSEVVRRWEIALRRTVYPRCGSIRDLATHWNAYATEATGPPRASRGPVRAESVDWSKHRGGVTHAL